MRAEKAAVRQALSELPDAAVVNCSLADLQAGRVVLPADFVPVGTVEFCEARMQALRIPSPWHMTYPARLRRFLGREIARSTYWRVPDGQFVKPYSKVKQFTGHIKGAWPEGEERPVNLDQIEVWAVAPVRFLAETRFYIVNNRIAGFCRYNSSEDESVAPDVMVVSQAVSAFAGNGAPAAYALDFGVLDDGRTVLVEANDGWALGYYRDRLSTITPRAYLDLICARWCEIAAAGAGQFPYAGSRRLATG